MLLSFFIMILMNCLKNLQNIYVFILRLVHILFAFIFINFLRWLINFLYWFSPLSFEFSLILYIYLFIYLFPSIHIFSSNFYSSPFYFFSSFHLFLHKAYLFNLPRSKYNTKTHGMCNSYFLFLSFLVIF
jgi:hypothetical protein